MKKVKKIYNLKLRYYLGQNFGEGTDNFDFSYYQTLPKKDQEYLRSFIDEFYHGAYKQDKNSVFYCPSLLENIKKDPVKLAQFEADVKDLNIQRKAEGKSPIRGVKALKNLLQKEAGLLKREGEKDFLNPCIGHNRKNHHSYSNIEYHISEVKDTTNNWHSEAVDSIVENERIKKTDEEELFLFYLKKNEFELYLCDKIIELIELKENSPASKKLIAYINELKEEWKNKELKSVKLYERLHNIHNGLNKIYKDLDKPINSIINNIFNNIIFNTDKYKQRKYYEEIKNKT
jgi:hypothetical protein